MLRARLFFVVLAVLAGPLAKADEVADVRLFLQRTFPGRSWDAGPDRLDSPELRDAYPGMKFYVIASREPLPAASRSHSQQETFRREMARVHRTKVTGVVGTDARGRLFFLHDANDGLRPVRSLAAARTACIAVITLQKAEVSPPGLLESPEVSITPDGRGWRCALTVRDRLKGEVRFDGRGRCTRAEKWYVGPLPPQQPAVTPGGLSP